MGHSIVTQATSEDQLHVMIRDAVRCHFDEAERPKLIRVHFVRDELIAAEQRSLSNRELIGTLFP